MSSDNLLYFFLAFFLTFIMIWHVGSNDLSNMISPIIGSKAINIKKVIIITIFSEILGAFFGSQNITHTMCYGLIKETNFDKKIIIQGILSTLSSSTTWMFISNSLGIPVSITQTVIGSILGFSIIFLGINNLHIIKIFYVISLWILSPILTSCVSFTILFTIKKIFSKKNNIFYIKKYMLFYIFLVSVLITKVIILRILEINFPLFFREYNLLLLFFISAIINIAIFFLIKNIINKNISNNVLLEKIFSFLMIFISIIIIFSHGANDIAVSISPLIFIYNIIFYPNVLININKYFFISYGCVAVILGMLLNGKRIIKTVGSKITSLTPSKAFCATISSSIIVSIAIQYGIPISATQTLVGGIMGVGFSKNMKRLNIKLISYIFVSWILTIPMSIILACIYYYFFKYCFIF